MQTDTSIESLAMDRKVSSTFMVPGMVVQIGRCVCCIADALRRCKNAHPEWFTKKTDKASLTHIKSITVFVHNLVTESRVIAIEKTIYSDDYDPELEYTHVCLAHFLAEIRRLEGEIRNGTI